MRKTEVGTGLFLILLVFSYITSLLLDFQFISPYASLHEDLSFLSENTGTLRTSTIAWMATSLLTLLASPLLFQAMRKKQPFMSWVYVLLISGTAICFFLMALNGFRLYQAASEVAGKGIESLEKVMELNLLERFRKEQLFRLLGSSLIGLWSFILAFSRLREPRFPLLSSILLAAGGPTLIGFNVMIFFNRFDMDHLGRTGAIAAIIIGVMLLCIRLINKGFSPPAGN